MLQALKYLFFGKYQFSPHSEQILKTYGNAKILKIRIYRHPLDHSLVYIANNLSTKNSYNSLFHVYLVVSTDLGDVLIEKNERPNITDKISFYRDSEWFDICENELNDLSVGMLIHNTIRFMGVNKFFSYSVSVNNCQTFCSAILQANEIFSGQTFIIQNIQSIFCHHKESRKILDSIVGFKVVIDRIEDEIKPTDNPLYKTRR